MSATPTRRLAGLALAAVLAAGPGAAAFAAPLPAHLPSLAAASGIQEAGYRHRRHRGGDAAFGALALGIVGLGIAAIAAQDRAERRRDRVYYQPQPAYQPQYAEPQYAEPEEYQPRYYRQPRYAPAYAPAPVYAPAPAYYPRQNFGFRDRFERQDGHGHRFRIGGRPEGTRNH